MKHLSAVIAVGLLGMIGCSMLGEREDRVLMPLSVGNTWTYMVSDRTVPVATRTYLVADHIKDGRVTFAKIEMEEVPLDSGNATTSTVYASNGLGLIYHEAPRLGSEVLDYFRFPVERNDRYWSPDGTQMCTSTAEDVSVPAGTFDVLIYGPCANYDRNRTMFVPNTGMTYAGDYEGGRAYHLSSFDLH